MDINTIKINLSKKSTEQLLSVLEYSQDDYTSDSIEIIKSILIEREIPIHEIEKAENNYKYLRKNIPVVNSQTRTTKTSKMLIWLLFALALMLFAYLRDQFLKPMATATIAYSAKHAQPDSIWITAVEKEMREGFGLPWINKTRK